MEKKNKNIVVICVFLGIILIVTAILMMIFSKKMYTISFDTDGGNKIENQIVEKGKKVIIPDVPIKDNFIFIRWDYMGSEYDFSKTVSSDMTLKAIWKEDIKKYKVTFMVENEKKVIEVSKLTDQDIENLNFPEKTGYILNWYINDEKLDVNVEIQNDITVLGKYEKVAFYTVEFNSNGGNKVSNQSIESGKKIIEPLVTRYGYVLDGWYYNNVKYDFNSDVTKNMTLIAKWVEDDSIPRYKVSFDSDGGSKVDSQTVIEKNKVTKPSDPTKNDYKFVEWQLNGKKYDFNSSVLGDLTLKALWRRKEVYTINFDSSGGTEVSSQNVIEDGYAQEPVSPSKSGFKFVEWRLNGSKYKFNTPVVQNIKLIAYWEELPSQDKLNLNEMINRVASSSLKVETGKDDLSKSVSVVNGCNLEVSNFPSQIERGISDTNINVTFMITCGSEKQSKTKDVIILKSPYTYSKIMNSNMLNYDVTINGGSWNSDAKLFLGESGGFNVINRKAVVEINKVESNPTFKMRFNDDKSTIYVVPFK